MNSYALPSTWTDDRVETLKRLIKDGYSAGRIADEIGGITRNAVIGKAYRMGLSLSGTVRRANGRAPRPRRERIFRPPRIFVPRPAKERAQPLRPAAPSVTPLLVTLFDLQTTHCRWPYGDPRSAGFAYCGHDRPTIVVNGGAVTDPTCSYCEFHYHEGRQRS